MKKTAEKRMALKQKKTDSGEILVKKGKYKTKQKTQKT